MTYFTSSPWKSGSNYGLEWMELNIYLFQYLFSGCQDLLVQVESLFCPVFPGIFVTEPKKYGSIHSYGLNKNQGSNQVDMNYITTFLIISTTLYRVNIKFSYTSNVPFENHCFSWKQISLNMKNLIGIIAIFSENVASNKIWGHSQNLHRFGPFYHWQHPKLILEAATDWLEIQLGTNSHQHWGASI